MDGRHLAWLAPQQGVLNVWVTPADAPHRARPLTFDRGRGVRTLFWSRGSDHVLYLRDQAGDENWRLYAVEVATGERRDLTPLKGVQARLLAASDDEPHALLVLLNDRDPAFHDVWRVDLRTGERVLVYRNTERFGGFLADNALELRFAMRNRSGGAKAYFRRAGAGWEPFLEAGLDDAFTTELRRPFERANGVLHAIDSRGRNTAALVAVDAATGATTPIAEDERADITGFVAHPEAHRADAYVVNHLRPEWRGLTGEMERALADLTGRLGPRFGIWSRTRDDRRWVVASWEADRPGTYWLYDRPSGALARIADVRPELEPHRLAPMHPRVVRARDGLELVSYLTLPPEADPRGTGRPRAPLPMVLLVHGGPWARDLYGFNPTHQWLANRGYAVLSVNYRGSLGFGKAHLNAGNFEFGRRMHDDLLDAVEWAVREGVADRARVAIYGASYGGYAALVGLTFTPEVFACGVAVVGISNLETFAAGTPAYWADFMEQFAARMGDWRTEAGRAVLRERSPLHRAHRIRRPLLIGHGANDPRVRQAESDQIVAAMKANGLPVVYALYPDEGHGFVRPANRMSFAALAERFLARYLGGRAEPAGELGGSSLRLVEGGEAAAAEGTAAFEDPRLR